MSHLFQDAFDSARKALWPKLKAFYPPFVLAGGTAIMLQIGHRKSYDFDCFTDSDLPPTIHKKSIRVFGRGTRKKMETPEIITVLSPQQVEVTFVAYPYAPLRPVITTDSIPIFHLDDLAANKAHTLGRRPAWRDYVDLFFLMKWKYYNLATIIELADKKYDEEFNSRLFVGQLTYFDDMDIVETQFLKESYTPKDIQSFLVGTVKDYLKTVVG